MKNLRLANICFLAILSLLTVSCRLVEPDTPELPLTVRSFSVSGVVTDMSGEPLRGIAVTIRAYKCDDKDRHDEKYYSIISTDAEGSYSFNKVWTDNAAEYYFVFQVNDPSNIYAQMEREMFLSVSSPFYSASKQSYDVTGNDFALYVIEYGGK